MELYRYAVSQFLNTIPSPRHFLQLPLLNPQPSTPQSSQQHLSISQTCPSPSLSCPAYTPPNIDTCCINHPSGHFLLAQFWDTSPSLGPTDSWTLHGLWPDYCSGGFPANCDRNRELSRSDITRIIDEAAGTTHPNLSRYMNEYWKGLHGDDDLWSHEWNKHGTCVSTLEQKCYDADNGGYQSTNPPSHNDLLDYFTSATTLHSTLQSHAVLASHNIIPSTSETYTLAQIQSALSSSHANHTATIKCNSHHELNEIWMHFLVSGPLRNVTSDPSTTSARFIPVSPDGLVSNCPASGIRYLPKHTGPQPTYTRPHTSYIPAPTGRAFEGRGHLKVHVIRDESYVDDLGEGCLIRQGVWYTSGQCATYRAKTDVITPEMLSDEGHLFTLSSSYAPCAVLEADGRQGKKGEFVCANHLPVQSIFGIGEGKDGGEVLSWKDGTTFFAEKRPGRFEKIKVFGDDGDGERKVELEIRWESS